MSTRFILRVAALGVLLFDGGCSSLIYYVSSLPGRETPPETRPGLTPDDIKAKFGKPVAVRPLPDGGQVATYEYRLPDRGARKMAKTTAEIHAFLWKDVPYLGFFISALAEPVFTGMAIYNAANPPRGKVMLTYGPDGRLLDYGPVPVKNSIG